MTAKKKKNICMQRESTIESSKSFYAWAIAGVQSKKQTNNLGCRLFSKRSNQNLTQQISKYRLVCRTHFLLIIHRWKNLNSSGQSISAPHHNYRKIMQILFSFFQSGGTLGDFPASHAELPIITKRMCPFYFHSWRSEMRIHLPFKSTKMT